MRRDDARARWTRQGIAALATLTMAIGLPVLLSGTAHADYWSFSYTGGAQVFVVPPDVVAIDVTAHGANGGQAYDGGRGSRFQATLAVSPGETLWVYVGGAGGWNGDPGFNGGGRGGGDRFFGYVGAGGGGATDIRQGADTLADRVLVAGGGGGRSGGGYGYGGSGDRSAFDYYYDDGNRTGGDAGVGAYSQNRDQTGPGTGTGGVPSYAYDAGCYGLPGVPGLGGDGGGDLCSYYGGGGGGGGGFSGGGGGGAGADFYEGDGGGGGGSSYVDASATGVIVDPGAGCCGDGYLEIRWTASTPTPLPTVSVPPLPSVSASPPPPGLPSAGCDAGQQIHDGTIAGVYVKLYVRQPAADRLHVCYRVNDRGGRLEITPTTPGGGITGVQLPSRDTNTDTCATTNPPNQAPGPHPLAGGQVLGMPYLFDTYLNGSTAWVCLKVGALVTERLVVPISVPGITADPGTQAAYYPDPA